MQNMAELFARDPREHTDDDIREIIKHLREMRSKFVFEGARAKAPSLTAEQQKLSKLDLDIKL